MIDVDSVELKKREEARISPLKVWSVRFVVVAESDWTGERGWRMDGVR